MKPLNFSPILSNLNLHSNRLSSINFTSCGTNEKEFMDLSHNRIEKLTPESFALNCTVVSLSIFENPVQEVDPQTISSMSVQSLSLGWYAMSSALLKNVFVGVSQSSIQELSITYVNLTHIPNGLFQPLQNKSLRKLDLSGNALNLQASSFSDLPLVSQLFIDDCRLLVMKPEYFNGMDSLRVLSMKSNYMYDFNSNYSMWKVDLHVINLSDNLLTTIHPPAFTGLRNLTTLLLMEFQSDPWIAIDLTNLEQLDISGSIIHSLNLYTPSLKHFICRSVGASIFPFMPGETFEYATSLTEIYMNQAEVNTLVLWNFDRQQSLFHGLKNLQLLVLSQNYLFFLFFGLFEGLISLEEIDLAENQIKTIANDTFTGLTSLHTLNLRGNELVSLAQDVLAHTKNLMNLYLDSNGLDYLDDDLFAGLSVLSNLSLAGNKLSGFNESTFDTIRSSLEMFDISGNPLVCNCGIRWLVEKMRGQLIRERQTICSSVSATLEPLRGKSLDLFSPEELCDHYDNIGRICMIIFLSVGLAVVFLLVYTNRWFLKYKLFLLKLVVLGYKEARIYRDQGNFDYDVNIMFVENDIAWATDYLRPALEERLPDLGRIAFGDDDLRLGMYYLDSVYDVVEKSFKTILLLSRAAIVDHIFITKFRIAMNHMGDTGIEDTVLIFIEEIPDRELPNIVRLYLSEHSTYLIWEEDDDAQEYFWNELKKHLLYSRRTDHMVPPE